jgi:two-component system, cell cycle sensor histidine kinase and response regulator CckA
VRRVLQQSLELQGYRVMAVEDGGRALAICKQPDLAIDLLITDVVMPLMSGPQLVQLVSAVRPTLPILYVSGYTDRALIHQGLRDEGSAFLQKPFTPDVLARKVRDVLDRGFRDAA